MNSSEKSTIQWWAEATACPPVIQKRDADAGFYKMRFGAKVTLFIRPLRRVALAMEERLEENIIGWIGLERSHQCLNQPSWVSQIVATKKNDGSIRICVDTGDVNKALKIIHILWEGLEMPHCACLMPHYFPPLTREEVSGNQTWLRIFNTHNFQYLSSLWPQRFCSVRWKSCYWVSLCLRSSLMTC